MLRTAAKIKHRLAGSCLLRMAFTLGPASQRETALCSTEMAG